MSEPLTDAELEMLWLPSKEGTRLRRKANAEIRELRGKVERWEETFTGVRPWVPGEKFSNEQLDAAKLTADLVDLRASHAKLLKACKVLLGRTTGASAGLVDERIAITEAEKLTKGGRACP